MSNPIPSQIALTQILNGTLADGSVVQANDATIESAVNALIAALSGGTAGQALQAVNGSAVAWAGNGVISETVIFNGTTTYSSPAGATKLQIEGIGAGAGGGGVGATGASQIDNGGGGGGGAWSYKLLTSNLGTHTVAVGAGGTSGVFANGNPGGDTSFLDSLSNQVLLAKGGSPGTAGSVSGFSGGGAGGAGSGTSIGDLSLAGFGGFGTPNNGGATLVTLSQGGGAARGSGGAAPGTTNTTGANPGPFPGGGGGGAANTQNQPARAGGSGGNGVLFVRALGQ